MSTEKMFLALITGLILSACTHTTTVVLMPDEDGKVGAVSVQAKGTTSTVDKAYNYTSVGWLRSKPADIKAMSVEQVNARFNDTLKAQPSKPRLFILYFVLGTSEITKESHVLIPDILAAAKDRSPTEISVIGHTDATGSEKINAQISLERAKAVEKILREDNPNLGQIDLKFFGERDPLIPTPRNVEEPRNRRVEIMIL